MSTLLNNLKQETNKTFTENGDIAFKSTFNANLDFFSSTSSLRRAETSKIEELFLKALSEDKLLAYKNLFSLRDHFNGNGERSSFRKILDILAVNDKENLINILHLIPDIGRWDDVTYLLNSEKRQNLKSDKLRSAVLSLIQEQLTKDLESDKPSLLAKWLPNEKSKNDNQRHLAKILIRTIFKRDAKQYRKTLKTLREKLNIVETHLVNKDYSFQYENLPAGALKKYTNAFIKHDDIRYTNFINKISQDSSIVTSKAENLYPYEIVSLNRKDSNLADSLWDALEKFELPNNSIIVRDGSASMYINVPGSNSIYISDVADSLAIYGAERQTGVFKDKFITFSNEPDLVDLSYVKTFSQKLQALRKYSDIAMGTDIEKTYDLIFEASLKADPKDYLKYIFVISDMEFNMSYKEPQKSTFENIKNKFQNAGIPLPKFIYWNLNSRRTLFPTPSIEDAIFVSGFSSQMFKEFIFENKMTTATEFMISVLDKYNYLNEVIK